MTCQHGGSWETCYIFACCGGVVEIQPLNCSTRFFFVFFSSPSIVNQVRQFNIVGLVRGVPLFPFSRGGIMTCQHGGSWETFCIFACCGGVVEIQPLNCSTRFFFKAPLPT